MKKIIFILLFVSACRNEHEEWLAAEVRGLKSENEYLRRQCYSPDLDLDVTKNISVPPYDMDEYTEPAPTPFDITQGIR